MRVVLKKDKNSGCDVVVRMLHRPRGRSLAVTPTLGKIVLNLGQKIRCDSPFATRPKFGTKIPVRLRILFVLKKDEISGHQPGNIVLFSSFFRTKKGQAFRISPLHTLLPCCQTWLDGQNILLSRRLKYYLSRYQPTSKILFIAVPAPHPQQCQ